MLIGGQRRILLTERKSEALRAFSRRAVFGFHTGAVREQQPGTFMHVTHAECSKSGSSGLDWELGWYHGLTSSLFREGVFYL